MIWYLKKACKRKIIILEYNVLMYFMGKYFVKPAEPNICVDLVRQHKLHNNPLSTPAEVLNTYLNG